MSCCGNGVGRYLLSGLHADGTFHTDLQPNGTPFDVDEVAALMARLLLIIITTMAPRDGDARKHVAAFLRLTERHFWHHYDSYLAGDTIVRDPGALDGTGPER